MSGSGSPSPWLPGGYWRRVSYSWPLSYPLSLQPGSPAMHPSVYLSPDYAPPPPSERQHVTCGCTIHSLYNTIYQPLPTYVWTWTVTIHRHRHMKQCSLQQLQLWPLFTILNSHVMSLKRNNQEDYMSECRKSQVSVNLLSLKCLCLVVL